eukprot:scaffold9572_cov141-Skeletonema_menzelii.AAC.2
MNSPNINLFHLKKRGSTRPGQRPALHFRRLAIASDRPINAQNYHVEKMSRPAVQPISAQNENTIEPLDLHLST